MMAGKTPIYPPTALPPAPFSRPFDVDTLQRDRSATIRLEASKDECDAVAASLGLESMAMLKAKLDLTGLARGVIQVKGEIEARLNQICVVSLDPFESNISETFEVKFAPPAPPVRTGRDKAVIADVPALSTDDDPPDPIINGKIDLGAVCVEFLALALDPYPRKPGVAFDETEIADLEPPEPSPFAALAKLRDDGQAE